MCQRRLVELSLRQLIAWLLFALLGLWQGNALIAYLLPFLEGVIRLLEPTSFASHLNLIERDHEMLVELSVLVMHPFRISPNVVIPGGMEFSANSHLLHDVSPEVILMSVLVSCPARGWRERSVRLLLGVFATWAIFGLTIPFHLLGNLETQFQDLAGQAGDERPEPLLLTWMLFLEMGGSWLLALVAAIACKM